MTMGFKHSFAAAVALSLGLATARDIPSNVQDFYDSVMNQRQCENELATGFTSIAGEDDSTSPPSINENEESTSNASTPGFVYCGHNLNTSSSIIYLQGRSGDLANMDICCDGIQGSPADDGRCESSPTTQSITAFQWIIESYGTNQTDLDANVHPYIVFGNVGDSPDWPSFDPQAYGIEPLSVMAVICNNTLFYGVWGDMNGDDGDDAMVGEASISLATACFGRYVSGNYGYNHNDILYIGFPGVDAVPGADGAAWTAQNFEDFEASIAELGDSLIERITTRSEEPEDGGDGNGDETDGDDDGDNPDDVEGSEESSGSKAFRAPLGFEQLRGWLG